MARTGCLQSCVQSSMLPFVLLQGSGLPGAAVPAVPAQQQAPLHRQFLQKGVLGYHHSQRHSQPDSQKLPASIPDSLSACCQLKLAAAAAVSLL